MTFGPTDAPFNHPDWRAEIKWDGYRAIVDVADAGVRVWTRTGREISRSHPELAQLRECFNEPVLLDAELCVLDEHGRPQFHKMRSRAHPHTIVAFDALRVGGRMLLDEPWSRRRAELEAAFLGETPALLLSRAVEDAIALFRECERHEIEGVVLKRIDSLYRPGKTKNWLKCKTEYGRVVTRERMRLGF